MWRATLAALILCAVCGGCESTEFYKQDTQAWFATPPPPPSLSAATPSAKDTSGSPAKQ